MMSSFLFALLTGLFAGSPVAWSFGSAATDDGKVLVHLTAKLQDGWHIYATTLPNNDGPLPTEFRFTESSAYTVAVPLMEPEPLEEYDPNFMTTVRYHSGTPDFTILLERKDPGSFTVSGEVEYMVCNDRTCLPPVVVPFNIDVAPIAPER